MATRGKGLSRGHGELTRVGRIECKRYTMRKRIRGRVGLGGEGEGEGGLSRQGKI